MAYIFLTDNDLEVGILKQFITERSDENITLIIETIEKKKIALIKTKLNGRYDGEAVFSAIADDRNYYIVDLLVKLVLYDFVRRNAARKVPSDYKDDFIGAMKTLEKIKAGTEVPVGLPLITNDAGESAQRVIHGNNRNDNFYI